MRRRQLPRLVAIGLCLVALTGLFVLGGAGWPEDPSAGPGIDIEDPEITPESNPGAFVETAGIVVDTDPVIIEIGTSGKTDRIELENAPNVELGDYLTVSGTLTDEGTLVVERERAITREPWEIAYMYLISVVGIVIVAAAGIDSWRFDVRTLSVEPRQRPLHTELLDRSGGQDDG